uniref:Uncharacterized protein n=1 Tax=Anopheles melas TaxID=34690 RepID=A0A182UIV5_9DIPT
MDFLYPVVEYYDIKGNEKYVNATIQAIGEHDLNVTYLMQFEAYRPVNSMKTLFVFYIRALDGAVKNVLFSRWIDGCAFLRRPDSDRLIKIFFDVIKEYSKVPRCPYKRGDTMVLNITPSAWPIPNTFFTYSVRAFNGAIQNPIISRWADPCELIRQPPKEKLLKMYYDPVVKNSRIIRCPFKPGDNMLLNITPSILPVPNFIPENDFYIEATTYTRARTKIIFESRVYGSLLRLAAAYYVVSESSDSSRLVQRTVDLCSYVRHPNRDRLVKVIFDRLKEEGNYFVTKCPIPRNEKFYIRNLRPTSVQIPGFIPESSFIFENTYQIGALFEPAVEIRYYGKLLVITHKEFLANDRVVNFKLVEQGNAEWNKTYLAYLSVLHQMRDAKTFFTYSLRPFNGAIQNPILSRWIDCCELLRRPPTDRLVRIFYDPVVKSGTKEIKEEDEDDPFPTSNRKSISMSYL